MADSPSDSIYELDRELTRDEVIDCLEAIPGRLREIVASQDAAALLRGAADGEWSAMETVRHIRDAVQVYGMRFKWMILNDEPFLPNYDEDRWVAESPDGPAELASMLDEVSSYRRETVRLLRALSPDGWTRNGRHEISGPVELEAYVRHELVHEEMHLEQLERALGRP